MNSHNSLLFYQSFHANLYVAISLAFMAARGRCAMTLPQVQCKCQIRHVVSRFLTGTPAGFPSPYLLIPVSARLCYWDLIALQLVCTLDSHTNVGYIWAPVCQVMVGLRPTGQTMTDAQYHRYQGT